jgi:LacI family transcriptional regulator
MNSNAEHGPVSLGDVAKEAKVSLSTASRALAGKSIISPRTIERVRQVAAQLGYRPNPFMRTLMATRRLSKRLPYRATLAWIDINLSPDDWRIWPVETLFFEGARDRAAERGYELERFFAREPGVSRERLMQVLNSRGVHGALFDNAHLLVERGEPLPVDPARFALVSVGCRVEQPSLSFAMNDCFATARLGHTRMRAAGYRRTILITAHYLECFVDYRFVGGYCSVAEETGAGEKVQILYVEDFELNTLTEWLKKQNADSVLVTCLPRVREAFLKQKSKLPRSFGYATLDFDSSQVDMAGVDQCHTKVGAAAVDLLINQLEHSEIGLPLNPHGVMIEGDWLDGASAPGIPTATVPSTLKGRLVGPVSATRAK